ncbi:MULTISPECIES: tetratricopeptide repeat protein [Mediterranea]|uniref:tetratricopeptide repeat protein n=1 Tax=Mediterranea TaxID=1926659 RepID=UPI00201240C5|nr:MULTISPECIES: tetratricopeptide repeat protein [Mediterranea]MCL1607483.1 tetratricopeptide repeat protein [Mediterranea sp. ET5]MDM8122371.1 tetratricopeptide repeat protein [Mediterranea massiliensis]MDM8198810.1 tetratricopeptide repeat protein [Mediterranea massiliensis]
MMNLLKKLFAGNNEPEENVRHKNEERNFDILKYDGIRAQRIGKWIYAEKCFKEALNIRPDLETASLLVSTSLQLNKLDQAHEVLGQMISLEPQRLQSYLDLARVCYLQEHYDDMLATAQQAAQLVPDNETPYFLQAQAYHKLGDSIHTIVALTQAISRKEDFTEAYLMRGQVLLEMKQYNEALEDVDFLLKHDSIDEEALRLAAEVQQGLGNEDEAVTYYKKVIDLNPFNEHSYEQIALILARKKEYAQAIATLDEALEINEKAQLYQLRGKLKMDSGDKEGALADMKKALELNPESENRISGHFDNFDTLYKSNNPLG